MDPSVTLRRVVEIASLLLHLQGCGTDPSATAHCTDAWSIDFHATVSEPRSNLYWTIYNSSRAWILSRRARLILSSVPSSSTTRYSP